MRSRLCILCAALASGAVLLAGCGGGRSTTTTTTTPVAGTSPIGAAVAYLRIESHQAALTTITAATKAEGGDRALVTVTFAGLLDDSVHAERTVLALSKQADGTWQVDSARTTRSCQPGRGHQGFTTRPCT